MLNHRDFISVGEPVPQLTEQEHGEFLLYLQKSILLSLEKRELLTRTQRERCSDQLEKQYTRKKRSQT